MSAVTDLLNQQETTQPQPQVWSATIAVGAAAVTDKVRVLIPGFSADFSWGPCRWMPRVHTVTLDVSEPGQIAHVSGAAEAAHTIQVAQLVYPQRGDEALVCFDENDDAWVLAWWPA